MQGSVEVRVFLAEQEQGTACGFAVERRRIVGGCEPATAAGEYGESAGDFDSDGVDCADVEPLWLIEQGPAELAVALKDGEGKLARLEVEAACD